MAIDDRRTGKTTRLWEEAVRLAGELPEDQFVYVTGAHTDWLFRLEQEFRSEGLVGIIVMTPDSIAQGKLRGCRGRLLVDDALDLPWKLQDILWAEKQLMEQRSG